MVNLGTCVLVGFGCGRMRIRSGTFDKSWSSPASLSRNRVVDLSAGNCSNSVMVGFMSCVWVGEWTF